MVTPAGDSQKSTSQFATKSKDTMTIRGTSISQLESAYSNFRSVEGVRSKLGAAPVARARARHCPESLACSGGVHIDHYCCDLSTSI